MAHEPVEQTERSSIFGKTRTGKALRLLAVVGAAIIALIVAVGFFREVPTDSSVLEPTILIQERVEEQKEKLGSQGKRREFFEERAERFSREARERREAYALEHDIRLMADGRMAPMDEDELAREKERRRKRRVRRFRWGSPAEERGKIWNVPQGEGEQALETALLRVCMAEADGEPQDCVGIWQVLKNIRNRSCSRGFVRRITECEEGGGETMLSAIRRAQPHILAVPTYKLRNSRAGWIRNLETDCEMPKGYRGGQNRWDAHYGSKRCPQTVELVRHLVKNELPPPRPGARLKWLPGRPITWGGRCETKQASCDDRMACARGLARITKGPETTNAFWCRPGSPGCRRDAEPICVALGYGHFVSTEEEENNEASEETKAAEGPTVVANEEALKVEKNI